LSYLEGVTYSLGQSNVSFPNLLELGFPLSSIGDWGMLVDLRFRERELLEPSDDIVIGDSRHVGYSIEFSREWRGKWYAR
jgi:hypothetical protein